MLSFNQITKSIVGIAMLAVVAGTISCGKKKGGGGSVATAPTNCESGTSCTVGQTYASGVFFRSAVGQANFGNNQNILTKLAFYAKNSAGLNLTTNPVIYNNGPFDVTGTVRIADGRYYGVSSTAQRAVAFFGIQFEFGIGTPQYNYGQEYWYPCGYNDPYCNGNGGGYNPPTYNPPTNCNQYQGGCNNNYSCNVPVGDYTVTTIQSGTWNGGNGYGYSSESFSNLKIRFVSGGNTVDATFTQGSLQSNNSGYTNGTTTGSSVLRGTMVINSVNNQACNRSVQF